MVPSATVSADSESSEGGASLRPDNSEAGSPEPSSVPFEQLLAQAAGSVPSARQWQGARPHGVEKQGFRRISKNRPVEQSSKHPVKRLREVVDVPSSRAMDPRFEDLSGSFDDTGFRKRYAFLYDEQLPREQQDIKQQLHKTRDDAAKQQLRAKLTRVQQQIKQEEARRSQEAFLKQRKAAERQAVAAGKAPYFPKRSEVKRQQLVAKYEQLKAAGSLDKYMAKKRQRRAAKDHKLVPTGRR